MLLERIAYLLEFFEGKFGKDKHEVAEILRQSLGLPIAKDEPDLGRMWWTDPKTSILRIGFGCMDFKNPNMVDKYSVGACTEKFNFNAIGTAPAGNTGWWTIKAGSGPEGLSRANDRLIAEFKKLDGWEFVDFGGYQVLRRPKG